MAVRVVETHVSILFFVGERVYKLKKPVDLGFLDWTTRAAREAACHREVELNRRLAPDVYLGVADLHGPGGEPLDHLVVMRRLPDERRLTAVLGSAGRHLSGQAVRDVARTVATFHAGLRPVPDAESVAAPDRVLQLWEDGFPVVRTLGETGPDAGVAATIEALVRRYVAGRAPLFHARVRDGKVRDGHGDLQADDIFVLDDGPRILDCLDFDDRLRACDVLSDVAFLAMDLERLGWPAAAVDFVRWYCEFSGEPEPASLVHFYIAFRAHVRAKVACIRMAQGDPEAAAEARSLQGLALDHLSAGRVRLVLVGGAPGAGKSSLAAKLAERDGWVVLSSDAIRQEPAGQGPTSYTPEARDGVYAELLARAERLLSMGISVIGDATWAEPRWRAGASAVAARTSSELLAFRCTAPDEETARRAGRRKRVGRSVSEAGSAESLAISAAFAPWPEAVDVDTSGALERAVATTLERLEAHPRLPGPPGG